MRPPERDAQRLLAALRRRLKGEPDVLALGVFGSGSGPQADAWSDLDAVAVVRAAALDRFWPALDWLAPLGEVFAAEQSAGPWSRTTRVCFTGLARLDLVLVGVEALAAVDRWERVPFWSGCRLIFCHDAAVAGALRRRYAPPGPGALDGAAFAALANAFWFKAVQTVVKVVRGDRLIALHLALDLLRDCCVLEMLLRDRETGTSVHRDGGRGNVFVDALRGAPPGFPAAALLDLVAECAARFDRLAGAWSPGYAPRAAALDGAIARAREQVRPAASPAAGGPQSSANRIVGNDPNATFGL
jgi:hypothetical protein